MPYSSEGRAVNAGYYAAVF